MSAKQDHTEPLVLDALTVAEPSFKKSPVISMVKRPYIQFAHEWNENNKQDIFKFQAELTTHALRITSFLFSRIWAKPIISFSAKQ